MKQGKLSFERDLWGQCNKLHDRLSKKKSYLTNLLKQLEPICDIFKDLQKKLESIKIIPDPTISKSLYPEPEENEDSKEPQLYGIPLTINKYIFSMKNLVDYHNQTFFHITKGLEDLLKKMKTEKDEYNNFVKCLKQLQENKSIMDKNMKFYQQKMAAAESSVLDLKRVEVIQLSINNDTTNLENRKLMEEKATQLTNDSMKPFKIYSDSLKKTNEIRAESIEKQKNLLYKYQYLEEEVGKTNTSIANILLQIEKIIKEITDKDICDFQSLIHNIKINKDIRQLIIDYKGNEKPEEEILFNYFPSTINFSDCDDNKSFEVYKRSIEFIKTLVQQEYPNYDSQLELDKNELRELLYKLFNKFEEEKSEKIKEYIMNERMHKQFLILLSKLRTNNRYQQSKIMIDFLGKLLNMILDASEKSEDFNNAKNCIILSQTFYYEVNGEKFYLLEKIKNHRWLRSLDFWLNFGDLTIQPELQKIIDKSNITKEDILNKNEKINANLSKKISEVIFSQILPFVNNMKDFDMELKDIVGITENFLHKYDYLDEDEKNNVFGLMSDNQDEINKLREKYQKQIKLKENEEQEENEELLQIEEKNIEMHNKIEINHNNNKNINIQLNENEIKLNEKEKEKEKEIKQKEKVNKPKEKEKPTEKEKENKPKEKEKENKPKEKEKENNPNEKEKESKGFLSLFKKKERGKEKDNIEELPKRSATVVATNVQKDEKNKIGGGIFKNLKNKFKKNKDTDEKKEDKKEEKKEEVKEDKKVNEQNTESKLKIPADKKMIKIDFAANKLQYLKPVPKPGDNKNNNTNNNNNNEKNNKVANPFGVVLKKIDKGKK
jgi:hypothetical protein